VSAPTPPLSDPPPDDPVPTALAWLAAAYALPRGNTNALALATVAPDGRPSARMVLLKELSAAGYAVFYTNYGSRKARELDATGRAAGICYWPELGRQIRLEGRVLRAPAAESDAYFATRAWLSQLNAWSSQQSQPLAALQDLEESAAARAAGLGFDLAKGPPPGTLIPRPPHWGGYRLWLDALELWIEGNSRFHERVRYERQLLPRDEHAFHAGPWTWQRLQP
jgi:pyridoxamine 5'-phosphate oxidase